MKKSSIIIVILAFALSAVYSCKKAGNDGEATLVVFPKHHGATIKNHVGYPDTIYVKYNATEAASSLSDYDTYYVGEEGEDHVHCTNLHAGKYYIFGAGYDSTINQRVTGGMAIKITHKERKQEIDQDLAVSE